MHVGKLCAVQAGGHHIRKHTGIHYIHSLGHERKVAIRVVHMEELGENAVLDVGKLPASQHAAGMHGVARLGLKGAPVRRYGGYQHPVAGLEVLYLGAYLDHLGAALVS